MSLDLIKSYLVGIGFQIDNSSLNNAQQKMNDAEKTVKTFAKNNGNSVASMKNSVGDIGALVGTSMSVLSKIFPNIKGPLNQVIGHINLVKQVFNAFSQSVKKDMGEADNAVNNFQNKSSKKANGFTANKSKSSKPSSEPIELDDKGLATTSKDLTTLASKSDETGTALKSMSVGGSDAIEALAVAVASPLALIAGGLAAILLGGIALAKFLNSLAQQNLGYEMLARQLWTTTQNAKEVDMALKTMGVTMQDLWLSPVLLAQFNQLRKDSEELKLPDSFNKNIVVVQELGFEFQRLQQAGTLYFQWFGSYVLQYIAGPLDEIKVGLHNFNDQFLKDIPGIAKVFGSAIGIVARVFLDLFQIIGDIGQIIGFVFGGIISYLQSMPPLLKTIMALILGINILAAMNPYVAAIMAIILVVDDLLTAMKGGKSVIGGFFADIKKGAGDIAAPFIAFGKIVKGIFADIGKFLEPITKPIEAIIKGIQSIKGLSGAGASINSLNSQSKVNYAVPAASSTNNTNSNSVANSNNKSTNTNTFNVYGTNPTSTAATIGKTLTGINIRNLQGVY